ncbi:hypothetical protein BDP27DRAFT_397187 [Rhodocollybia butyracea]|uniref:Uncharacterized protein n=1 Tax=Rhodocollybia butyracea TaxID=206335 RepID=A0A9P5UB01_9AGAR|nr:hypothetical protein BDP27DRAFT_397187 [Rhodocollybia butyracea]
MQRPQALRIEVYQWSFNRRQACLVLRGLLMPKDVKGKGKIKASDTPNDESENHPNHSSPMQSSAANDFPLSSPDSPSLGDTFLTLWLNFLALDESQSPNQRNSKSKRPVTYVWSCPVVKCSKAHTGMKMGGEWGPER